MARKFKLKEKDMVQKTNLPRSEKAVRKYITDWCAANHPRVEVQKAEYEKFVERTSQKKIIDTTIIGRYKKKSRSGAKGCLIMELEFEEHKQTGYSILKDMLKITIPLRKIYYYRNDIPQYWIKVDNDGTPFMINYRHIYDRREQQERMDAFKYFTEDDQLIRIIAADRNSKKDEWPRHVIIGWDKILKELKRVIRAARF
jgi:hypothetical protein